MSTGDRPQSPASPTAAGGGPSLRAIAVVLLVVVAGILVADAVRRPWRKVQARFRALERQQLAVRLEAARLAADGAVADRLERAIASARASLAERAGERRQLERDERRLRERQASAETRRRLAEARLRAARAAGDETAAAHWQEEAVAARRAAEGFAELAANRAELLATMEADLAELEARRAALLEPLTTLEARYEELAPGFMDLPVVGRLWPGYRLREIAPRGLDEQLAGHRRPRRDRCPTCHLAASRPGYDDAGWPEPLRSHPRPELFLAEGSSHPAADFGCTVCHGGVGRATDFTAAGHVPRNAEQAAAWARDWGWRPGSRRPILAGELAQAGCSGCHDADLSPVAPLQEAGARLVRRLGCAACHRLDDSPPGSGPPVGPALDRLAAKTSREWAYHFIAAPRTYSAASAMPRFFDAADAADRARLHAIVTYLFDRPPAAAAGDDDAQETELAGDATRGADLFAAVGCAACHLVAPALPAGLAADDARLHGPALARLGNKVAAGWLRRWLRAPSLWQPRTAMPDVRLGEDELADVVAYLSTRRDPAWEDRTLPAVEPAVRDELIFAALAQRHTLEASQARLDAMGERQRELFLGQLAAGRYACGACHAIPGIERPPPRAADLRAAAERLAAAVAQRAAADASPFADALLAAVAGHDWPAPDAPAMPQPRYDLRPAEALAIAVDLLGRRSPAPPLARRVASPPWSAGRAVLERYNCRACHALDRTDAPPPGAAPSLRHEGARVRADWLFDYLDHPETFPLRPWLDLRMPSYPFDEGELDRLVTYFAGRDGVAQHVRQPPPASDQALAVGRAVFATLGCGRCHAGGTAREAPEPAERAPSYRLARRRLRPAWTRSWILDPQRWSPGTAMPASFPRRAGGGHDLSFLPGMVGALMYREERARALLAFDSEEALDDYLQDPDRVAEALRAYLWSLGR